MRCDAERRLLEHVESAVLLHGVACYILARAPCHVKLPQRRVGVEVVEETTEVVDGLDNPRGSSIAAIFLKQPYILLDNLFT